MRITLLCIRSTCTATDNDSYTALAATILNTVLLLLLLLSCTLYSLRSKMLHGNKRKAAGSSSAHGTATGAAGSSKTGDGPGTVAEAIW
jgi:hypothetical protein